MKKRLLARVRDRSVHPSTGTLLVAESLPTDEDVGRDLLGHVRQGLEILSPEHREVLKLCTFDQLKYDEIADRLAIPVGLVRRRVAFAREVLWTFSFAGPKQ